MLVYIIKIGSISRLAEARCVTCLGNDMASHCVGKVVAEVVASAEAAGDAANIKLVW